MRSGAGQRVGGMGSDMTLRDVVDLQLKREGTTHTQLRAGDNELSDAESLVTAADQDQITEDAAEAAYIFSSSPFRIKLLWNYTPLVGWRLSNHRSLSVDTLGPEYDSSASEPSPVVNQDHIKVSPPVSLDTPMHPTGHQPVAGVFNAAEEVTGDATKSDATKSDDPTRAEACEDAGAEARNLSLTDILVMPDAEFDRIV
ncbi:hypothetical protein BS47DRAFT_1412448 [Hydnum rufescens UP504]|uniref:Uncharacterized protein n=1 Tax=Hydnum rufescens UP504 TaxID=1448309 RepID=A0A9P6APN3_9AGAM|nr:hypothetical protein BS47DRAFT_1412448 [Hydnum rufescens UP504]